MYIFTLKQKFTSHGFIFKTEKIAETKHEHNIIHSQMECDTICYNVIIT